VQSTPLAIELLTLILIGLFLAAVVIAGLMVLLKQATSAAGGGTGTPPPPPPPPPYAQPLKDFSDELKRIQDENPTTVSADDCRKLRDLLKKAKDAGLPGDQADQAQQIVDQLCPQ
jgi:hypothetical protein